MQKTIVYIDGFNFYYGQLKGQPYKWLDLHALFSKVLGTQHDVIKIKYFTARVQPTLRDPDVHLRQDIYLKALQAFSPLTLHGVRRWLMGEVIPTDDKVQVLAGWLNVDFQQLRPGVAPPREIQEQRGNWQATIPQQERDVVDAFLALPMQQRKIVREVILAFAKAVP